MCSAGRNDPWPHNSARILGPGVPPSDLKAILIDDNSIDLTWTEPTIPNGEITVGN